jgi:hypothetical protein
VVEATLPEVAVRISDPAYPLPEDREISVPVGAVTVTSPLKVEPDTVKVCVEEAVPYVVLNALAKVVGATEIVGEEGAKGVPFTTELARLSPAEFTA